MDSVKSNPSILDEPNYESFDVVDYEEMNSVGSSEQEAEAALLKVMFHGTKNTYRFGENIHVRFYSFNDSHTMEEGDRVGIAPLKRSPFYSKKIADAQNDDGHDIISEDFIEETQITSKKLNFVVDTVPAEIADERFFQFCYLNSEAQVIGLSVPFQFLKSNQSSPAPELASDEQQKSTQASGSSVMEIEVSDKGQADEVHCERQEDDDFIVVRTTDNFLKERVHHLTRNNNLIQNLVRNLQTELAMKIQENKNLEGSLKNREDDLRDAQADRQHEQQIAADEKETLRKNYELTIAALQADIAQNQARIAEQNDLIQLLTDEMEGVRKIVPESEAKAAKIEELTKQIKSTQQAFDEYRAKREIEVKDLEDTLRKSMDNLKNMNLKFENAQADGATAQRDLRSKLKNEQDRVTILLAKLEESKIEYAMAQNRMLHFKNKTFDLKREIDELKKLDDMNRSFFVTSGNSSRSSTLPRFNIKTSGSLGSFMPSPPSSNANPMVPIPMPPPPAFIPSTTIEVLADDNQEMDEIDSRLNQLEREEMENSMKAASASSAFGATSAGPSNSSSGLDAATKAAIQARHNAYLAAKAATEAQKSFFEQPQKKSPAAVEEIIIEDEILEPLGRGKAPIEPAFQTIPKAIPVIPYSLKPARAARFASPHVSMAPGPSAPSVGFNFNAPAPSAPPAPQQAAAGADDYNVVLPCVFCNESINCRQHSDGSGQMREMIEHLESVHNQKMCPICSTLFDMNVPVFKTYFTNHVQEHLKSATYPTLER